MEEALLGNIPEWFAVRFLTNSAFDTWNEFRFEREFTRLQDRNPKTGLSIKIGTGSCWKTAHRHEQPIMLYPRGGKAMGIEARNILEPSDLIAVACGIREATSIPLGSVHTSGKNSVRDGLMTFPTYGHEQIESKNFKANAADNTSHLKMDPSSFDSATQSHSSNSSASTSLTEVTDTVSFDNPILDKSYKTPASSAPLISRNEPTKVGIYVDLNQIDLSLRFEYLEDPKTFLRKHSNDSETLQTLAIQLQKKRKNTDNNEEIVVNGIDTEEYNTGDETADDASVNQCLEKDNAIQNAKLEPPSETASKFLYVGSSLFDAHDYSIVRKRSDSHWLGNNFVGYDRYRMSAALTREERLEKLVPAIGDTLEVSVRYFLEECPDPDATVPGHDDIKFIDVLNLKRQSFATSRTCPTKSTFNNSGHSIQIGFPDCTVDSYANSLYCPLIDFKDRKDGYFSNKQHVHHFGLGVFRIDPQREAPSKQSTPTRNRSSESTCAIEDSESTRSSGDRSKPREMPGLIGDENNRHDPRHRATIPPGHILAPGSDNAFRSLRLERDPRHARWRRRSAPSAPDPSALYASGPPVAMCRHSEQSFPVLQAESMPRRSWTRIRNCCGKECPKDESEAVDGATDEPDEEDGVACGEPDPDAMVELYEMTFDVEETTIANSKEENIVALEKSSIAPAMRRDDPLRKPRQVRRVRFQL